LRGKSWGRGRHPRSPNNDLGPGAARRLIEAKYVLV